MLNHGIIYLKCTKLNLYSSCRYRFITSRVFFSEMFSIGTSVVSKDRRTEDQMRKRRISSEDVYQKRRKAKMDFYSLMSKA